MKTLTTYEKQLKNHLDINLIQRKALEKSLRHQSDSNGNIINLTKHSFTKTEYKLLNKNLNFIPSPKVFNKNKLDADLNDFF